MPVVALGTVVLGLAHLLFTITGQAVIARYSPDDELDLGFGWFTASYSVGQALGPLLGGALVGAESVTGDPQRLADVDHALWVGAALALLAVPLLAGGPRRRPPDRRAKRPVAGSGAAPGNDTGSASGADGRLGVGTVLRAPGVTSNLLASMGLLAMLDILTAFLPLVGKRAGVGPTAIGALLAVRGAASILSRAMLPWLSRRSSRHTLLVVGLFVSGSALALPPLVVDRPVVAGVFLAAGGFFLGSASRSR